MFIYSKLTGSLIQMQISLCLLYTYNLCDEKFVTKIYNLPLTNYGYDKVISLIP